MPINKGNTAVFGDVPTHLNVVLTIAAEKIGDFEATAGGSELDVTPVGYGVRQPVVAIMPSAKPLNITQRFSDITVCSGFVQPEEAAANF